MKELILNNVADCASALMYYDRKEDEELPLGAIEKAIAEGVITKQEIIDTFAEQI